MAERLRRVPIALWIVLLLGVGLRVALWFAYEPTPMIYNDTLSYVGMAGGELFSDPSHAAGYSMLLAALHAISPTIGFAIFVQHLLGIATALLVYGAFRRLEAPGWVAVVAAGAVLLSLDQIFLEHSLLTEATFTLAIAAVLYASIRALEEPHALWRGVTSRMLWIALAGVALGLSAWVRPLGVPLVAGLALWFAFAIPGRWSERLARAGLAALAAGLVLAGYAGWQSAENGTFGFSRATGWTLYSRVAEFADCDRFDPPAGTEDLCETIPEDERPGPDFYGYSEDSPARQLFGGPPTGDAELGSFARAVLLAQPLDYIRVAGADSLRYFRPSLNARPLGGGGYEAIDIDGGVPVEQLRRIEAGLGAYYTDADVEAHGLVSQLADLQDVLRLQPWLLSIVVLLGLAGLVLARARLRAGVVLALGIGAALLVIPTATAIWGARYAVPATGPLVGAAAIGGWLIYDRLRNGRRATRI